MWAKTSCCRSSLSITIRRTSLVKKQTNKQNSYSGSFYPVTHLVVVRRFQHSKIFCLLTGFKAQISHIIDKQTNRQTDYTYLGSFCLLTQLAKVRRYHSLSMFQRKDILFVNQIYSPKEPHNRQIYK